jgi:hypothetical protein
VDLGDSLVDVDFRKIPAGDAVLARQQIHFSCEAIEVIGQRAAHGAFKHILAIAHRHHRQVVASTFAALLGLIHKDGRGVTQG